MTDIAHLVDTVICGDCIEVMRSMDDNCADSIITDPPYGLGFMGKDWDTFKPEFIDEAMARDKRPHTQIASQRRSNTAGKYDHNRNLEFQVWFTVWAKECLRVAKPGVILMAFGGTRTYHRLTCAIEDAGWEIRDCIQWIYGSGFPKSLDISKAIDKAAGAEREVVGKRTDRAATPKRDFRGGSFHAAAEHTNIDLSNITAPATELAKQWDGWGTALKPSWEPIIVAMKPLDGTFAQNAEKWGVAGLWIDGGRIDSYEDDRTEDTLLGEETIQGNDKWQPHSDDKGGQSSYVIKGQRQGANSQGRFPSNTILDESAAVLLDEQSGERPAGGKVTGRQQSRTGTTGIYGHYEAKENSPFADSGGASRFFYCAKSSKAERNAGCGGMEAQAAGGMQGRNDGSFDGRITMSKNHHPTVKPLALMEYLCKLTKTPTGGIVLDPFAGSGTTGIAAYKTNRQYILIEKEREYCDIAEKRIQEERDKYALFETAKGGD